MRVFLRLTALGVSGLLACAPIAQPTVDDTLEVQAPLGAAITVAPGSGLTLDEVVSRVNRGYFQSTGEPLRRILDVDTHPTAFTNFKLAKTYSTLGALAADMQQQSADQQSADQQGTDQQDATYQWTAFSTSVGEYLVIKPSVGSYLDKTITNFSVTHKTPCQIMRAINAAAEPSTAEATGCLGRATPQFISETRAAALATTKVSFSATGTQSVEDITVDLLDQLDADISITLLRLKAGTSPVWDITW